MSPQQRVVKSILELCSFQHSTQRLITMPLLHTKIFRAKSHISSEQNHKLTLHTKISEHLTHFFISNLTCPPHSHLSSPIYLSFFILHPSHADPSNEEDLKGSNSGTVNSGDDTGRPRP